MSEKKQNPMSVTVTASISVPDTYSSKEVYRAELKACGPLSIESAIDEVKNLASKCVNAIREASVRAAKEQGVEKVPVDPDAVTEHPF